MATKQYPVTHTEAEWHKLLSPEQYAIMREHGTEYPGSCALNFEKRAGTFVCAACEQPLFVSHTIPSRARSRPTKTPVTAWCAPRCIAAAAAAISAMSSPTARRRRAYVTASTAWR